MIPHYDQSKRVADYAPMTTSEIISRLGYVDTCLETLLPRENEEDNGDNPTQSLMHLHLVLMARMMATILELQRQLDTKNQK